MEDKEGHRNNMRKIANHFLEVLSSKRRIIKEELVRIRSKQIITNLKDVKLENGSSR